MKTQISRLILLVLVAQRLNISWFRSFLRFHTVRPKKSSWSNWAQTNDLKKSVMTNKERVRTTWHRQGFCASPKRLEDGWPLGTTQGSSTPALLQLLVPEQFEASPRGYCLRSRHQNPNQHIAYFPEDLAIKDCQRN